MSSLNSTLGLIAAAALMAAAALLLYGAWRRRVARLQSEEADYLQERQPLSQEAAMKVVRGETTLEALETEVWSVAMEKGLDFEAASRVRDGERNEEEASGHFPFKMRPVHPRRDQFQMLELAEHPAPDINGSIAAVWFYGNGQHSTHLVLAGHANGPVCKELTSLLMNSYLNMEQTEETLLVPGACLLRGPSGAQQVEIRAPAHFNLSVLPAVGRSADPLLQAQKDFVPFVDQTGLTRIYPAGQQTYWESQQELIATLRQHYRPDRAILLRRRANGQPPAALFVPYVALTKDEPIPLTFELPLSLFETDDFDYLKNVHQQALLLEMGNDAMRRKRIYEDWLNQDEQNMRQFQAYYNSMPEEKRIAQTVHISGSRDFLTATVRQASEDGKEVYISPKEHIEKNLPALLEQDRLWIARMEQLLSNIQGRDKERDARLEEINVATLIDSFIRGWASVFLSGDEARQRYERWCEQRREQVWRYLHRQLARQGNRMDPLLEDNTIFQVTMTGDDRLQLRPMYVLNQHEFLIYLSPEYGIPFYINRWSRREKVPAQKPSQRSNREMAADHYQQAMNILDTQVVAGDEAEAVQAGVAALKQALIFQPLYSTHRLWNDWWRRFARDTEEPFTKFQGLMQGIESYNQGDKIRSEELLETFIKQFPDHLPEPYLLLSLLKVEAAAGADVLRKELNEKSAQHKTMVDSYNQKVAYLQSNEALIKRYAGSPLYQLDPGTRKQLEDVERISQQAAGLQDRLAAMKEQLEKLDAGYKEKSEQIWEEMRQRPDAYILKAREIDSPYIDTVIKERKVSLSQAYWQRFRPVHDILKGDAYIQIAETLMLTWSELKEKELDLGMLKQVITGCLESEQLDKVELNSLVEFQNKVENIASVDSLVRELVLRSDLKQIAQNFFQQGLQLLRQSAYLLPEFTEPVKRLISIESRFDFKYRASLVKMGRQGVPLRNFAPGGLIIPLTRERFRAKSVSLNDVGDTLLAWDESDRQIKVASVTGLTEEEHLHLKQSIESDDFLQRKTIGVTAAEQILNRQIQVGPRAQRWARAMQQLEPWLLQVIAYGGILPIPDQPLPENKVMAAFERPAVNAVHYDLETVAKQFATEITASPADFQFVDV